MSGLMLCSSGPAKNMACTAKSLRSVKMTVGNQTRVTERGRSRRRPLHTVICRVQVLSCRPAGARKTFRQKYRKEEALLSDESLRPAVRKVIGRRPSLEAGRPVLTLPE